MIPQIPQLAFKYRYKIALVLVGILITLCFAWWAWRPDPPKPETYKPEVKQADGSVILEKKPDAAAKPAQEIPKGARLVRKATITMQAKLPAATVSGSMTVESVIEQVKNAPKAVVALMERKEESAESMSATADCPPVTVDLSLVEMPDKSQRVVASSPDGQVLGGVDIPVQNAEPQPEQPKWAAGAAISTRQNLGVWVDRDLGFMRIGAQINTTGDDSVRGVEAWGKVGIRF